MARGRSSGGSSRSSSSRSSGSNSRSTSSRASPPPMQRAPQQTAPTQSGGGMMSGIGSTIVSGMAFGAGSEVAHQAVRSVMGGSSNHSQPEQVQQQAPQEQQQTNTRPEQQTNPCLESNTKFVDCLKRENNDISSCQNLFDDLKSCEKNLFR